MVKDFFSFRCPCWANMELATPGQSQKHLGNVTGSGDPAVCSSLELRWPLGLLQGETEVGTPRKDGETGCGGEGSGCQNQHCRGKEVPGLPWVPDEGDRMRWSPCEGSICDSESGRQARRERIRGEKITGGDAGHGPEDRKSGRRSRTRRSGPGA